MKEVYVVNCCRTAVGSFGGSLKDTPATELGAVVVKEALNRAGVKPEQVDELMFGCVLTAALGQNPARQAVYVISMSNSHCCSLQAKSASATARSSGVVIFKLQ